MSELKKSELAADTTNGVYVCEISSEDDVLPDEMFYEKLATLKDGEVIHGLISDEMVSKIEAEYGIH